MKNNKKKAFTLVELLVVIAILAILASVSVVGYIGFTEKANKSVDEQMCTQYNNLIKAENVENPDLSLKDIILLIELNGIRSDQLLTKSKAYEFVYDRENQTLVLMNKETGNIEFPTNYEPKGALWTVLREDLTFPQGINHAEMLYSFSTNSQFKTPTETTSPVKNAPGKVSYYIEMNNCTLRLNNDKALDNLGDTKIEISTGTLVSQAPTTEKIQTKTPAQGQKPATVVETTTQKQDWGIMFEQADINKGTLDEHDPEQGAYNAILNKFTNTLKSQKQKEATATLNTLFGEPEADVYTISDKYFSAQTDSPISYSPTLSFVGTEAFAAKKTIVLENCSFENLAISFAGFEGKIIVRNCKFFNCLNWTVTASASSTAKHFSYEMTGNEFINCGGGFNVHMPFAGEKSIISNNYFDMMDDSLITKVKDIPAQVVPAIKQKFMEKNNALQISGSKQVYDEEQPAGLLEISNNKVLRATSLINLHTSLVGTESSSDPVDRTLEQYTLVKDFFINNVTVSNNDLRSEVINKVYVDPDAKALGTELFITRLNELKDILNAKIK